jgi:hypothetical protein
MLNPYAARVDGRAFLNLPGFHSGAYVVAYVEDTSKRECDRIKDGCLLNEREASGFDGVATCVRPRFRRRPRDSIDPLSTREGVLSSSSVDAVPLRLSPWMREEVLDDSGRGCGCPSELPPRRRTSPPSSTPYSRSCAAASPPLRTGRRSAYMPMACEEVALSRDFCGCRALMATPGHHHGRRLQPKICPCSTRGGLPWDARGSDN